MKINLSKEINLNDDYEVIVIGGGPSGCAAAIAAARDGANTLLIEGTGALGGMGTNGLVPAWCPFSDGEKVIYQGVAQKILEETKSKMKYLDQNKINWVAIDPEALKVVYDDNVLKAGAQVLFNTYLCDVKVKDKNVDYIIVNNKMGLTAYKAKVYIDCTGDADLVYFAGGAFEKNDELQSPTHCFMLSNVNQQTFDSVKLNTYFNQTPIWDIQKDDSFPLIDDTHVCNELVGASTVTFNAGHIFGVDSTDPFAMSKAYIIGRKKAMEYRNALSQYLPDIYGDSFVAQTAPSMGVRESRRIVGDYTLTLDDYLTRRTFEDEIGRNCYYIDVHSSSKDKMLELPEPYAKGESHGIPYRCLVPKDFDNVLVAGRSISTERLVQGSIRIMPACLVTGEAAGCAAAVIVKNSVNTHTVSVQLVRSKLKEYGAYFK